MKDVSTEDMWRFLHANAGHLKEIWLSTGKCKYTSRHQSDDIDYFDDYEDEDENDSEEQEFIAKIHQIDIK